MKKFNIEYTDTFGGEVNYAWVRRTTIAARTERGAIRAAKFWAGLTGVRCVKWECSDGTIDLRPVGSCTVLFIEEVA